MNTDHLIAALALPQAFGGETISKPAKTKIPITLCALIKQSLSMRNSA